MSKFSNSCLEPTTAKSPSVGLVAFGGAGGGFPLRPSRLFPFIGELTNPSGWWVHGLTGSDYVSFRVRNNYRA